MPLNSKSVQSCLEPQRRFQPVSKLTKTANVIGINRLKCQTDRQTDKADIGLGTKKKTKIPKNSIQAEKMSVFYSTFLPLPLLPHPWSRGPCVHFLKTGWSCISDSRRLGLNPIEKNVAFWSFFRFRVEILFCFGQKSVFRRNFGIPICARLVFSIRSETGQSQTKFGRFLSLAKFGDNFGANR